MKPGMIDLRLTATAEASHVWLFDSVVAFITGTVEGRDATPVETAAGLNALALEQYRATSVVEVAAAASWWWWWWW